MILWSPQALHDLTSIREYVAVDSPRYAALVVERIVRSVERLEDFPRSGRIVPERGDPNLREVIVTPYRVVYRLRGEQVDVVTVFRASRLFPAVT